MCKSAGSLITNTVTPRTYGMVAHEMILCVILCEGLLLTCLDGKLRSRRSVALGQRSSNAEAEFPARDCTCNIHQRQMRILLRLSTTRLAPNSYLVRITY